MRHYEWVGRGLKKYIVIIIMADFPVQDNHTHNGIDSRQINESDSRQDLVSKKFITFFESIDGYNQTGGSYVLNGNGFAMSSTVSTAAYLSKNINNFVDFSKPITLKAIAKWDNTSGAAVGSYIYVGNYAAQGFGFSVYNGYIRGEAGLTTPNLQTISNNVFYKLEARFYPNNKIQFFVDDILMGTISGTLPTGTTSLLSDITASPVASVARTITIQYFEFLQITKNIV